MTSSLFTRRVEERVWEDLLSLIPKKSGRTDPPSLRLRTGSLSVIPTLLEKESKKKPRLRPTFPPAEGGEYHWR